MNQTLARFVALWSRCGGIQTEAVCADLVRHYAEPARHYHTLQHIRRCMRNLDWARAAIPDPDAVEMALWCHDMIYVPGARDNERRSADWFLGWADGRIARADAIAGMILATTHASTPADPDGGFAADIDLADLGADRARIRKDAEHLRSEHPEPDEVAYAAHERVFLGALLAHPDSPVNGHPSGIRAMKRARSSSESRNHRPR